MISFSNVIEIDRPVATVYRYLSDLSNTPRWNWAIDETVKVGDGPIEVGSRYLQRRSVPRPATEELVITALDQDRLVEVEGTLAGLPARLGYRLAPGGSGTIVTNDVELQPAGALRLAAPLIGGRIREAVAANLAELKSILERSVDRPD